MSKIITLRKGLDINLAGKPQETLAEAPMASEYALSPLDFEGVTPKLLVKVGDKVKAGTPLFFNKYNERVLFTSPVSGTVAAVNRGEKRKVLTVTVTPDAEQSYEEFGKPDLKKATREELVELLLRSGLWPMIVQRPYGIIADPTATPKAIFVSAFDSAPLAPDYNFVLKQEQRNLQAGIDLLRRLTSGKVHLSMRAKCEGQMPSLQGAELHTFAGKHPVGNVGVQIHHIDPINKGDIVWTVNIQDLAIIGRLVNEGRVDMHRIIAVDGSEIEKPGYVRVIAGARVDSFVKGNVKAQKEGDRVRFISGNVLTGTKTALDGFLGFYANQLTAIPEGDKYELLGWAMPRLNKFSVSRAYFSWLCPKKEYKLDTNLNGGERPFVVTGLYERYLPMDIYPMYLLKACLAGDIEKMENLGIYEVTEEDFALCEFVDPSKIEIQQIIRDGINLMIKEA
ncbi:Na(+)-translocating NADH-quinone reductase subunit A [Alistipes sp.]|uniref:Na(+)-translocating NADH-quinone reductase subunit A n=1 Tax=Alistipes sp. TaxID=1872444 RepID=UPI0025BF0DA0|nr:Na(+)-translocating NADH-quinone reductase subunit A [Alistipes sp.]MCI7140588.1 Na(+)-translocating NADH-quinone reductase subunit A [Alistipes sp.]MDY5396193.1 Na(+)-translocating NADH-quinone reductase subunit A [Alistipes sp.]